MRRFYKILLLLSILSASIGAFADKTVNLATDTPAATSVFVSDGYGATCHDWDPTGKITLTLGDKTGFNLNVNNGYSVSSISVDGTVLTSSVGSTYYVEPKYLVDGCTVDIRAVELEKKRVIVAGDPSQIQVSYMYQTFDPADWNSGTLEIALRDNTSTVQISAREGFGLRSVIYNNNNELEPGSRTFTIYPSVLAGGDNRFTVESYSLAELRSSSFRVHVEGDASNVIVRRAGDATEFTGAALSSPIPFSPEIDLPVTVRSSRYDRSFYQVSAGGRLIEPVDGEYRIPTLADGDAVEVKVDYPDIDIPVRFHFANADTEGAVESVCDADYSIIDRELWLDPSFTVKMGSIVRIFLDDANYVVSASLDGAADVTSNITFTATDTDGYDITVTAEPREPFEVTFYYEGLPSHFHVLCGNSDDHRIEMTGKDTTKAKVPRNLNRLRIIPDGGWLVAGVYLDGVESGTDLTVNGNAAIDVYMQEYSRDENMAVYFGAGEWDFRSLTLSAGDPVRQNVIYPSDGYTLVKFNREDLPAIFDVMCGGVHEYVSYINGEPTSAPLAQLGEVSDGTVVKFFAAQPAEYTVTFDIAEDADATVVGDLITDLGHPSSERVLAGTEIMVLPAGSAEVKVKVDGTEIAAGADRNFRFVVDADCNVEIVNGTLLGLESAYMDDSALVMSLQGIILKRNASAEEIKSLPAGLYIINGKKVAVK